MPADRTDWEWSSSVLRQPARLEKTRPVTLEMNESHWTYRAPKPAPQAPADLEMSNDDWTSLTPGMRREITAPTEQENDHG